MAETPKDLPEEELIRLARSATKTEAGAIAYASSLQISWAGNDAVLQFARPRPAVLNSGETAPFMLNEVSAIIYVSMATLKDFSLAVADQLSKYEAQHGPIETDYTRRLAKR